MKLHPGCVLCKKTQVAQQDVLSETTGKVTARKGDFLLKCSGIPAEYDVALSDLITKSGGRHQYSPDEIESISRIQDPVAWAADNVSVVVEGSRAPCSMRGATPENIDKYELDETAAYYQELMLKCTANRLCFRIGRRSGKSFTLTLKILHQIFTKKRFRVLVITPYLAQLDLLFDQMIDFITASESLSPSMLKHRKTPQRYLELHNGSWVKGFTSGNTSIRGQAADMVVLDEADYLTTDDLSAIVAILTEHKDTFLFASSTPSGARETFWRWDQDPYFRSFHYPSMCRPEWDADMEMEQRKENPGVKFLQEILAEYGSLEQGVFQSDLVDLALEEGEYEYSLQSKDPAAIYTIGVDWNPVHGTEIVVQEGSSSGDSPVFRTVDVGVVYRDGSTQLQAMEEIARLNRKWLPEHIYVDRGAGSVQVEILEEMGHLAEPGSADARLAEIITPIDFGSKITMYHPVDGTEIKEYAKPAMVENAVRRVEAKEVVLSKYDPELVRQMKGFCVKSINSSGRPSYGTIKSGIEDHRLDAWMLSMFAFTMEKTRFGTREVIADIGIAESLSGRILGNEAEHESPYGKKGFSRDLGYGSDKIEKDEDGYLRPSDISSSTQVGVLTQSTQRAVARVRSGHGKSRRAVSRKTF
jgi:hypothetical protein